MDDDDEFGDLYADVLQPLPSTSSIPVLPPPSPPKPHISPATDRPEDSILGPAPIPEDDPPLRWNDDDDDDPAAARVPPSIRAPEENPPASADGEQGIGDFDIEQDIPGLGPGSGPGIMFDSKRQGSEEWDSDSDDGLMILLNDDDDGLGGRRTGIDDDEDGEDDDLVIVADDGRPLQFQGMEEQEWGEEALQVGLDGEKKEGGEAAKVGGGTGATAGQRAGYGHTYHPQHNSQFKYIRPGAMDISVGAAAAHGGAAGQVRPPLTMGLAAGRGRGMQKGFHSGYGPPGWGNNNLARPFGIGLDFTLPSHKTIFEVNIDSFDEKPWRLQGVDITDFFNFGLDEATWKDYCRQLEQFRLESTMQSKIRVYESGRSDHDYDADLPPELAAASGIQDLSSEKAHPGKMDSSQMDVFNQGMGTMQRQSQLPTGRAIQVESGYGERLPSMETRPPRTRDFEAVIEIVCQDFDSDKSNTGVGQPGVDSAGDVPEGCLSVEETNVQGSTEHGGHLSHSQNERRDATFSEVRGTVGPSHGSVPEGHEASVLSSKALGYDHCSSKAENSSRTDENLDEPHEKRQTLVRMGKSMDNCIDSGKSLELSPSNRVESIKELSTEHGDEEPNEELELPDSQGEGEDNPSDLHVSSSSQNDHSLSHSAKKVKLSSQVEHPSIPNDVDVEDLGTTFSDHSIAKSGSSMNYVNQDEGGEDEVDFRSDPGEGGCTSPKQDDRVHEFQHGTNGVRVPSEGDRFRRSQPHKSFDSNSVDYEGAGGFERLEERGGSVAWSRRDVDAHDLGRKDRDAKRRHSEEVRLKDRNRTLMSDRKIRGDDVHHRKGSDNNDWRTQFGREGARQRERNSVLMKQNEYFEDAHANRRKDEEQRKRECVSKESLHAYHLREDSGHGRRGRNDSSESRIKEDVTRARDRIGNSRSSKHKDEGSKPREREDRQRMKVDNYAHSHRDRDDVRAGIKASRSLEDKSYGANTKNRGDRTGSDNDLLQKDRRHDQLRRGDRAKGEGHSQHKSREEFSANLSQVSREEKSSRHGRFNNQGSHASGAFSNQHIYREGDKENSKRSKNPAADQNGLVLGKRRHEDYPISQRDKGRRTSPMDSSMKGAPYQEVNNGSDGIHSKKDNHPRVEKAEGSGEPYINSRDDTVSDDENQQESRRGRSKLERWTSHKERDYSFHRGQSSLRADHINGTNQDIVLCDELTMTEVNKDAENLDNKDSTAVENSVKEERDRHLETVEKLKKRSERFNLPMPGEKEITATKRVESELPLAQNETLAESEIKQERPTRKRRWVSS